MADTTNIIAIAHRLRGSAGSGRHKDKRKKIEEKEVKKEIKQDD
jgi:hypothetical protein